MAIKILPLGRLSSFRGPPTCTTWSCSIFELQVIDFRLVLLASLGFFVFSWTCSRGWSGFNTWFISVFIVLATALFWSMELLSGNYTSFHMTDVVPLTFSYILSISRTQLIHWALSTVFKFEWNQFLLSEYFCLTLIIIWLLNTIECHWSHINQLPSIFLAKMASILAEFWIFGISILHPHLTLLTLL